MASDELNASLVDGWLQPLPDEAEPCGKDLEYDNDFLALNQTAAGRPETQFDAGAPPDWREVRSQAEALLDRSRDLRVAVLWLRAVVNLEGFAALPQGLRLLHGLLESFWDQLHPKPDPEDNDPYARMNALGLLIDPEGLLADLRNAQLFNLRSIGELRGRSIELALNQLSPRDDETPLSREQVERMLADATEQQAGLRELPSSALAHANALSSLLQERVGYETAPDLRPLQSILKSIDTLMPSPAEAGGDEAGDAGAVEGVDAGVPSPARGRLSGAIQTREDAVRAIDMVCEFLERTEPTNPAPLLLRRARRMISHNFLQLMKELAPEALPDVAKVMGVDPESVQLDE